MVKAYSFRWSGPFLAILSVSCFGKETPLEGGSCPCAQGWVCCANHDVCARQASECPAGTGASGGNVQAETDASGTGAGGQGSVIPDGGSHKPDGSANSAGNGGNGEPLSDASVFPQDAAGSGGGPITQSDASHDGAAGGQPEVVSPVDCDRIYQDTNNLYCLQVADDTDLVTVLRVAKSGGEAVTILEGAGPWMPYVALDDSNLYWNQDENGGRILATPTQVESADPGATKVLVENAGNPAAMAVDDTNVYWIDWGYGYDPHQAAGVWMMPKTGGTRVKLSTDESLYYDSIVVTPTHVYWSAQADSPSIGMIFQAPIAGGTTTTFVDGITAPSRMATNGGLLGWWCSPFGPVGVMPAAGGDVTIIAESAENAEGVALDPEENTVYWTTSNHELNRYRVGIDTHPVPIAWEQRGFSVPVVDTSFVYYPTQGKVMRLAK